VAWNLQGLGHRPLFVSAVGQDLEANQIRHKMSQHGLDLDGLQTNRHPTGSVHVDFVESEPNYQILPEQAYDFIRADTEWLSEFQPSIIYHGSLIWRSDTSREAIRKIRSETGARVFVDLNIRAPWFELDWLNEILAHVDFLKLNHEELKILTHCDCHDPASIESAARDLLNSPVAESVDSLWVTAGSDGAYYFNRNDRFAFAKAPEVRNMVDTVGAGDAFSAAVIDGTLKDRDPPDTLKSAVHFAASVCQIRGATTDQPGFYRSLSASGGNPE
jgi:fructokinase